MARRATTSGKQREPMFSIAERVVMGLYDAGVLSPAVLQHVLLGFMQGDIDWNSAPAQKTVDGKSIHEVVSMTMMPGSARRNPAKDFLSVVDHLRGASAPSGQAEEEAEDGDEEEESGDDEALLDQLGGATAKRARATRPSRKSASPNGFNPLFRATSPNRKTLK